MKITRVCPGSGHRLRDWTLQLYRAKEGPPPVITRTCLVCKQPVEFEGDLWAGLGEWVAREHAEIVEGEPVEES